MALLCGGYLRADFMTTSQSASYDPVSGLVTFRVTFNQTPDFFTTDSGDRPATEFQYYIIGDPSLYSWARFDSIIRGPEIYLGGDIPIRAALPTAGDPHGGGWGAIRGTVPFTVVGTELTFSAPLSVISDHSTDGHFSYDLQTGVFGRATQYLEAQQSTVLPEPATTPIVALTGVCWLFLRARAIAAKNA